MGEQYTAQEIVQIILCKEIRLPPSEFTKPFVDEIQIKVNTDYFQQKFNKFINITHNLTNNCETFLVKVSLFKIVYKDSFHEAQGMAAGSK